MGKESFEELNTIVKEHVQLPYYKVMSAFVDGRENEFTQKSKKLYNRSSTILDTMIDYSSNMKLKEDNLINTI